MITLEKINREKESKPINPIMDKFQQIIRNRFAIIGLIVICSLTIIAISAPLVSPYDPNKMDLSSSLQPPSGKHIFGTDKLGRDIFSRLIFGSRISLTVGFIVQGIALLVGVTLGAISGYFGGIVDSIIMRIVDIVMAFPFLILSIAIVAIIGPSLTNMMIVLGGVVWINYARIIRGMFLTLKEEEFVVAARVLGAKDFRIIFRHILPSTFGVIIVQSTFGIASAILAASALSFLGMGVQPPTPEWGGMLSDAKPYLRDFPMMTFAPGLAIMITVLAINFVGDALRDAFDPRVLKI